MFRLTAEEVALLKSQSVISSEGHGGRRRSLPQAFTEQGVAMLSSVLHTPRAIQVNVEIMRAFVRLRELLATHKDLALRLEDLEHRIQEHDLQLWDVFEAIRQLLVPPEKPTGKIGFKPPEAAEPAKKPSK